MEPGCEGASASKPRSWSCYDRARRRNRTDKTSGSSSLPGGSRRHHPADGAPNRSSVDASARADAHSSSASAAAVSAAVASALAEAAASPAGSTNPGTRIGVAPRRGIDALSVPAADGVATTLRFQWVRPHPSYAFLLAAASAAAADGSGSGDGDGGDCEERPVPRRFRWGHDRPSPSPELSGIVYYPRRRKKRRRATGGRDEEEEASGNGKDRRSAKEKADEAEGGARRGSNQTRLECAVGNGNGGDCVAGEIRVDASDLCFDPPLLTEWLPGVETSCSYDVGDTTDDSSSSSSGGEEDVKDESSEAKGGDDEGDGNSSSSRSSSSMMELLGEIMAAYRSSAVGAAATTEDDDSVRRERRLRVLLSPLARLPARELSNVLPSHLLVKTVSDCYRRKNPDRDADQLHSAGVSEEAPRIVDNLTLALVALCSLAAACPSEGGSAIGRHIFRVLSPVALDPSSYRRRSMTDLASGRDCGGGHMEHPALTRENEGLVRRLADLLVSDCGLGELSRSELRALLSSSVDEEEEDDGPGSELMDELRCCVSEAFLS